MKKGQTNKKGNSTTTLDFEVTEKKDKGMKEYVETDVVKELLDKKFIEIRPFVRKGQFTMGLESYGMVMFPEAKLTIEMSHLEINNIPIYNNGLNEFSKSVQLLSEEEKYDKICNIRTIIIYLEKILASNIIKINDEDFYGKCKVIKQDNLQLWSDLRIVLTNSGTFLHTEDPNDLMKYIAILEGGYADIAKNYELAISEQKFRFYINDREDQEKYVNKFTKERNKAIALLEQLAETKDDKIRFVAKKLDKNGELKMDGSRESFYNLIDKFLNDGESIVNVKEFERITKSDFENLKIEVYVDEAMKYSLIKQKEKGEYVFEKMGTILGSYEKKMYEYFKNPLNEETYKILQEMVEKIWRM